MKSVSLQGIDAHELVSKFTEIGLQQDDALLGNEIARFNRLFDQKIRIVAELKARPGDQRRLLMSLFDHENAQVRLNAVHATLAVEPVLARRVLEDIANSRRHPQAGDAGMSLWNLDRGVYRPT